MVIVQLSDLHLDGTPPPRRRLAAALQYIRARRDEIDAVLVTGDVADHGLPAEYEEALSIGLRELHPATFFCPGNHDRKEAFRTALLGMPSGSGALNSVHDLGAVRVILCDSTVPGKDQGHLGAETLSWLSGALRSTPPDVGVIVALHHPPVGLRNALVDPIRLQDAAGLAAVLAESGAVIGVLCGHAHVAAATQFCGRPLVVAPAVASTIQIPWRDALGLDLEAPPAIAIHVIDDDGRLTTHFRPLVLAG